MTSNHPEVLDPALIRPGRIDRQIHLGHVQPAAGAQMLAHYFGKQCDAAQCAALEELLGSERSPITPAVLESLCARFGTIGELLDELREEVDGSTTSATGGSYAMPVELCPPPPSRMTSRAVSASEAEAGKLVGALENALPLIHAKRQKSGG